jgi:tRNA modification GTPase
MLNDVIAAVATPPGRSAIALIRVSGSGAHDVAGKVLQPFAVKPERCARRAHVVDVRSGEVIDDALYVSYRGPRSYTGEDAVDISTHGGLLVPIETLSVLFSAGARQAEPGEFSRRAVLNGKMDLLQAEAVGDLVDATAPAQRRAALAQLDRGLSRRIEVLRQRVLDLDALVCYDIDFPEEDSGPVPPERIDAAVAELAAAFNNLLDTAPEGERLREGALVVIAGLPNVGKSSLFNALLGTERAIVTEIPGTTRDAIEAPATCGGFPFRLVDTAGLRETDHRIEKLGIEVSQRYLKGADVVLFCAEAGRPLNEPEHAFLAQCKPRALVVRTKSDNADAADDGKELRVSALTGEGLAAVRAELARVAFSELSAQADVEPVITRARHRAALEKGLAEIQGFRQARLSGVEAAVAAVHLHSAVNALEDVIGVVTREDVLERVFESFCVGK